ncbi:MAG TPA: hypothetical protein VGJ82_06520 [Thermoanaerobaculia bacterium]
MIGEQQRVILHCEFCNAENEYPLVVGVYWREAETPVLQINPDPQSIIYSHLTGDATLTKLGFFPCPAVIRWHTTEWQLIEKETGKILNHGRLVVTPTKTFSFE